MTDLRLTLPTPPAPPAPWRFPVVAVAAPVVLAGVLWLVTGSLLSLVFAALGPVTALASVADQRWGGRRQSRREKAAFASALAAASVELERSHERERAAIEDASPDGPGILRRRHDRGRWQSPDSLLVVLGTARIPSRVELAGPPATPDSPPALLALTERARALDAPLLADAGWGVGVVGPVALAGACARGIVLQLARSLPPDRHWYSVTRAAEETWLAALPHRRRDAGTRADETATVVRFGSTEQTGARAVVAVATTESEIPPECRVVISFEGEAIRVAQHPNPAHRLAIVPGFVTRVEAAAWVSSLAQDPRVRDAGESGEPPRVAALAALLPSAAPSEDAVRHLACEPMVGATGPISIDLVADGPHSIVGGTTGSGKSELLVSWVVAMAAAHSPERVSFLLVDFKGGSAFGPLAGLPHTVGTITDLDDQEATRALASIRAELRLRERTLAEAGARSIEECDLPRLVIVVDEFAAMLAEFPDLHALFTDIAARGRSLGVHLILCTQRPAGAVRDGVLANADLRISLRVNNRADSDAVVGVGDAAELDAAARGRAIVRLAGGAPVLAQVALASPEDVASVSARWAGVAPLRRPWRDRLPARIPPGDLVADRAHAGGGIPVGVLDLPDEQRQETWAWDPQTDGHLVILGAPRTGKSTALAAIGGFRVPSSPPGAWDAILDRVASLDTGAISPELLVIDDLDALVPRFSPEHRGVWLEWIARLLREGPARGIHLAISAQRLQGELNSIGTLAPTRLMLGHGSRQDWVLAGGDGAEFLPATIPGAGRLRGHRLQVAMFPAVDRAEPPLRCAVVDPRRALAVASTRVAAVSERLRRSGWMVVEPEVATSATSPLAPLTAVVAEPDDWQARWGLLNSLRETSTVVLDACSLADARLLTRSRQLPPPLPPDPAIAWQFRQDGTLSRVRLPSPAGPS